MAGATLEIETRPGRVFLALSALLVCPRNPTPRMRAIRTGLLRNTQDGFEAEATPNRAAWVPLIPGI